ncbi:MAG: substrate-binding domain-containing protein [Planctomycetes bacterium]|nr:substrate-binding domain-containing protein [Planctomycetota bacterium]
MRKPVVKDRVQRYLLQKLAIGEWTPGHVIPSLRKASYELRISHRPVNLVWREAIEQGLLARNERGEAAVTERGPELARAILAELARRNDLKRLAILLPQLFSVPLNPTVAPLQSQLVQAVTTAATARSYDCRVISLQAADQLHQAADLVRSYDAAFIVGLSPQYLPALTHLAESGLPTLMYQRKIPGVSIPSLTTDYSGAARRLAELLVSNGHRNITLITSLHSEMITDERVLSQRGWFEALESTGILHGCAMPVLFDLGPHNVMLEKLLALRPRVTGLVVGTPSTLVSLTTVPQFSGLRVPEDLSVAAISSVGHFVFPPVFPPITCFDVDWPRAGQCAVEIIDQMIGGNSSPKSIRVPLHLRLTDSIGQAPVAAQV